MYVHPALCIAAYIPAPIYFGMLLDSVCLVRGGGGGSTPDSTGAWLEYGSQGLPFVCLGVILVFKLVGVVCVSCTWWSAR